MNSKKTGEVIKIRRKKMGLTQRELAGKLGICDKTISKWEVGKGMPELSLMVPLCDVLNITTDELLRGELKARRNTKQ